MANIKYRIIEVHPNTHSIVVRYYSDLITEDMLATHKHEAFIGDPKDQRPHPRAGKPVLAEGHNHPVRCTHDYNIELPIPAPEPGSPELDAIIWRHCPREFFERKEKMHHRDTKHLVENIHKFHEHIGTERPLAPVIAPLNLPPDGVMTHPIKV